MKTVRLTTCDNSFQAHVIKGALENEGIPCVLHNEHTSDMLRGFAPTIAGVDIFVYESDYGRACKLLENNNDEAKASLCCPHCGGHDIKIAFKKRKFLAAMAAFLFSWFLATPPGNNYHEYECKDCGTRF